MIFNIIITIILGAFNLLFAWCPDIPQAPAEFSNVVNDFFDLIFSNSGLVSFFLPISLVKIVIPIVLVLINFKYIYYIFLWVIRKLPFSMD